ncbi:MAG: SprT family zinc-dependent metalloprotease [Erysipelotrichaceae bacterium]
MKNNKKIIKCMKHPITYTLVIKNIKHMYLRISKSGNIEVSADPFKSLSQIDEFVSSKYDWILNQLNKLESKNIVCEQDDTTFTLFGRILKIKICNGKTVNKVFYDNEYLYIQTKGKQDPKKLLTKFVDQLCMDVFIDIIGIMRNTLSEYDIPSPSLKIRTMSSRWGSCIPDKQQITLNRRLIHYPIEFIEYVVLHELVHFVQPNHSKTFYAIVENHMSDYKKRIQMAA